ncbi:MAG: helix-turn-helix transcriptional regulator [Actinomycetota bacterium]
MKGAHLVREARRRAGLTQADLADRAGTTQSAIARLERGGSAPSLEHIVDLVRSCGLDLRVRLVDLDDDDWALARQNLALDPDERVERMLASVRFAQAGREALAAGPREP